MRRLASQPRLKFWPHRPICSSTDARTPSCRKIDGGRMRRGLVSHQTTALRRFQFMWLPCAFFRFELVHADGIATI